MSGAEYRSTSLTECREILCREWSRHVITPRGGQQIDLHFSHRKLSGDMTVSRLSYGADVGINPLDRDEVLLIQMPMGGRGRVHYPGSAVAMSTSSFGVIDVRRVDRVDYDADFSAVVVRVRIQRVREYVEAMLGRRLRAEIAFDDNISTDSMAWSRWAPSFGMLHGLLANTDVEYPERMLASMEEAVLAALVFGQPHCFGDELLRPVPSLAPRHVKRAEDFVQAHAGEPLSTALIAAHVNVSVRTLFDGFRAFRNMSPSEYVRNVRLERARIDLLEGSATVSLVASKWGFSHLGNFASHYREKFGESPVETLKFSEGSAHG